MTANGGHMETMLEQSLEAADIAVCVKDIEKRVLRQNESCRRVCGDQLGKVCDQGCMALYAGDRPQQWKDWGPRIYKKQLDLRQLP